MLGLLQIRVRLAKISSLPNLRSRLGDRLVSVFGLPFDATFAEAAAEPVDDTTQADEPWKPVSVCGDTYVADGRRGNQFAWLVPKQVVPAAVATGPWDPSLGRRQGHGRTGNGC